MCSMATIVNNTVLHIVSPCENEDRQNEFYPCVPQKTITLINSPTYSSSVSSAPVSGWPRQGQGVRACPFRSSTVAGAEGMER